MSEVLDNYLLFMMVCIGVFIIFYGVYFLIQQGTKKLKNSKVSEQEQIVEEKPTIKEITKEDKNLFEEMLLVLPYDSGSLEFLKTDSMDNKFHSSQLDDLYKFYYDWSSDKHKFPNTKLDEERNKTYDLVGDYIELLVQSIEERDAGYIKATKNIDRLHIEAKKVLESYQIFIESTQKKLLVLE